MSSDLSRSSSWCVKTLLACHVLALAVVGSWLWPATREVWDGLDESLFFAFNGSLEWGAAWRTFWGLANWRPVDAAPALIFLFLFWRMLKTGPKQDFKKRIFELVFLMVLLITVRQFVDQFLKLLDYRRLSPTKCFEGVNRLSKMIDWIEVKDSSKSSFPGDHAYVLMMCSIFLWRRQGAKQGLIAVVCLFPFMLPRLVGGAHWLTDVAVGALTMALVSGSWWFATPFSYRMLEWSRRWHSPGDDEAASMDN